MQIPLGQYAYKRGDGLLPSIHVLNAYAEKTPTDIKTGVALLTRPNLELFATVGVGPIKLVFWEDDVFTDDALIASGTNLYRMTQFGVSTLLGALTGTGRVEIASSPTEALIASGGLLQQTNGVTLTLKAFPDDREVVSVGFINGYFLAVPKDSHRIYYTDPLTGLFGSTRYVSAERYADDLSRIVITQDEIWAFGSASVEVFVPTGVDATGAPPFQRVEGRLYRKGALNAATIVEADNTIFFAGYSKDAGAEVYRGDAGVPVAINDESIAERLSRADPTTLKAWAFGMNKHTFYVLAMGTEGTWAYDILTGGWYEWSSINRDQWRAHTGRGVWPGTVLAGDDETGALYSLSDTGATDNGAVISQRWTAGVPLDGDRIVNNNATLDCAVGQAAIGVSPEIGGQYSDDQGRTWSELESQSLGLTGEYDTRVRWNRLGQMTPPARIFEWFTTSPVRMRVSGARINDSY